MLELLTLLAAWGRVSSGRWYSGGAVTWSTMALWTVVVGIVVVVVVGGVVAYFVRKTKR